MDRFRGVSRKRECEAADCQGVPQGRSLFCPDHEHEWVAAAEIPLEAGQLGCAVRRAGVLVPDETWVVVRDVYCQQCRQPHHLVANRPCDPYSTILRGGPLGTRKRRADDDTDADVAAERP